MPFRLQTSSDPNNPNWKNPAAISIYDNGWKTTKVGYVYDMGWKVVYPDPIIPIVNVIDNGSWAEVNTVNVFYVQMIVNTSELESMVGQLYSGTSATGTPLQTQTFNYEYILEGYEYYVRFYVSSPGTYTIKATATSITENSVSVVSQPISPRLLSVNITSASLTRDTYSVSWTSVGQEEYTVSIEEVGPGITGETVDSGSSTTARSSSGGIFTRLLGNTQYDIFVGIRRSGEFLYTYASIRLTTPAGYAPAITNFSATSTCNSITTTWTNNSDVDSIVINIAEAQGFEQSMPYFGLGQNFNLAAPQNSKTFLNLNPYGYLNSPTAGIYQISIYGESVDGTETGIQYLNINTLPQSVNPPTNFTATSDYHGKLASFTWTAATANCTSVTGYRIEYKLGTSSTWLLLSNSIASNAVSFSAGGIGSATFAPGRTYNFRIFAKSSVGNSVNPATANLTMNNNPYGIIISGTSPINTFTSTTLSAQIRNANSENILSSGYTISWSFIAGLPPNNAAGSSVSPQSSVTNSSGIATTTFTAGSFNGNGTVYATTPNLGPLEQGIKVMTVALSPALNPSLSSTRTNQGYDVTHSNYNSSWGYSGIVDNGGFSFDNIWNDGFYSIIIKPTNSAAPVASRNALVSVTCTSGTWTAQPSSKTRVTSTRQGYFAGIGEVTNSPTGTLSFLYTWYYGNGELLGTGQTRNITAAMRGRNVYCVVKATRTGGVESDPVSSASIPIPS